MMMMWQGLENQSAVCLTPTNGLVGDKNPAKFHLRIPTIQAPSMKYLALGFFFFSVVSSGLPVVDGSSPTCLQSARFPDLYEASIRDLEEGLDRGDFTSVDLVTAYLKRIDQVNVNGAGLRAVLEVNPRALERAAALDIERMSGNKRSALHGIPILVKDNIATSADEGMNTTAGSYALLGSVVPGDATVVKKLRKAGAIILGKTNLSEWSYFRDFGLDSGWSGRGGQATNPYYPRADPCGSSAGSGVATAVGLAAGSLGTETDGSIICPSSYNNLVGIKPTVGLTSRTGVIPVTYRQDTVGPMTRSVTDAAIILSVIAGYDPSDNYTKTAPHSIPDYTRALKLGALKGKRIGVPRAVFMNDFFTGNHPSINIEFDKALDTIRSLGGIVVDHVYLPSATKAPRFIWDIELPFFKIDFKIDLNRYLKRSIGSQETHGYNSTYFTALEDKFRLGREEGIDAALLEYDLDALILPSNGLTTNIAAIAGYPIVTVPLGFHPDDTVLGTTGAFPNAGDHTVFPAPGVPFGLSFLGTAYSEFDLVGYAYAYEQVTHTRLKRRAYPSAIPSAQLESIVAVCPKGHPLVAQGVLL
ncbi:amidase [Ceratobasidium sp. AG-Ba]|nr:amidase [Ceratobasidium sp. AG-Ba]QRV91822.1 amidase [Ceratobasidium sp. AG-Ba]